MSAGAAYGVAEMTSSVMGISPNDAHSASFMKAGMSKAAAFKAVAHGLSRAAIAKLRYGTGKGAFLSGFITSGFSVGAGAGYKGAFVMAIVGGTASELGGGKFANGAWGSAFQYMFNDMTVKSISGFVKHYFEDGSPRYVTDEYILSDSAQNRMRVFENEAIEYTKRNGSFYGWSQSSTDVTFESAYLFSIGDSSRFYMSASCSNGSCYFTYDLFDRFRDPLDIGIGLPYSKPYDIYGHWTKEISY